MLSRQAKKISFELYHWSFPIVGKVTYKGFFTKRGALREKRELDKKGYDTYPATLRGLQHPWVVERSHLLLHAEMGRRNPGQSHPP